MSEMMDDAELIADVKTYKVIKKIIDGCSGDEKYKLQKDGKYFLLRIGDKTVASEKKREYDQLAIYADRDMNTQKPIGIIDFSGNNIGDPWYEFGGLLWALEYSDSFANGQIDGYFEVVPEAFWKIFKFYVALYAFEHLAYSSDTPEDIKNHIYNAERMINIFGKNFELEIPLFRKQKQSYF